MNCHRILGVIALVSCGGKGPVTTPHLVRQPPPSDYKTTPHLAEDNLPPLDNKSGTLDELTAWTRTTIESDEFQKFLAGNRLAPGVTKPVHAVGSNGSNAWPSVDGSDGSDGSSGSAGSDASDLVDGVKVLRAYLGADKDRPIAARQTRVLRRSWWEVAHTWVGGGNATVYLRTPVMSRAAAPTPEARACAVNTLAHEWTHTIPDPEDPTQSLYQDDGHRDAVEPLVSYTVGAIAQCVYLRHDYPALDLQTCVQAVGTTAFNPNTCAAGWAASVIGGSPPAVEPAVPEIPHTNFWAQMDMICSYLEQPSGHMFDAMGADVGAEGGSGAAAPSVKGIKLFADVATLRADTQLEDFCKGRLKLNKTTFDDESVAGLQRAVRQHVCSQLTTDVAFQGVSLQSLCAEGGHGPSHEKFLRTFTIMNAPDPHAAAFVAAMVRADGANDDPTPSTGASIQSTVVSAVVAVISSRAKAELQQYAISTIKSFACTESRKRWFAKTCAFLQTDTEELPVSFGSGLRSSLIRDLQLLPANVALSVKLQVAGNAAEFAATAFVLIDDLVSKRADVYSLAIAMKELGGISFLCRYKGDVECARMSAAFRFGAAAIESLAHDDGPVSSILMKNLVALAATQGIELSVEDASAVADLFNECRENAKALYAAKGSKDRLDALKPFVTSAVDLVNKVLELAKSTQKMPDGLPELADAIARGDTLPIVAAAVNVFRSIPSLSTSLDPQALRVISFAGELAEAKDADQAKAAIESVIAPVGSYRMKSKRVIASLGAYVGFAAGKERLRGDALKSSERATSTYIAPSAYLGVDLSFPFRNPVIPHGGLFVSVIDVGSLMSYRTSTTPLTLSDGTAAVQVAQSSNVGFTQLLSPGVFARVGIANSPFLIGAGVAFVPEARELTDPMTSKSVGLDAIRWTFFAAIDVTLLPFHL